MAIHEMEYRGLNLLDEVCTVELAIDEETQTVHIFDTNHVVEPTYHFTKKVYELGEGFMQMVDVLRQKYYFVAYKQLDKGQWIDQMKWIFYSSNKKIKVYKNRVFNIYDCQNTVPEISYEKYMNRLKEA